MSSPTLSNRVRRGFGWNAASMIFSQVLGVVRSIIVARLLFPGDFGLFAMASTLLSAANALTSFGFDLSVITRKFEATDDLPAYLDTVWTVELGRRIVLSLILVVVALPAAAFYHEPQLYSIMPLIALTPFLQGFQNVGLVMWRKQLDFARIVWFEQSAAVIGTFVSITLAFLLRNYWALVIASLLGAAANVVLSYWFHPYRPHLRIDPQAFRDSFHFGKHIFWITVMTYITTMADNVLLGRLAGAEPLGVYALAYNLAVTIPVSIVTGIATGTMISAYAEMRTTAFERIGGVLDRVIAGGAALLVLMLTPLALFASELISVFYGAKWSAVIPLLHVLAFTGLMRGLTNLLSPLSIGMNRPELEARAKTIEGILFLVLLYPLIIGFGSSGAAWAGTIVYGLAFAIRLMYGRQLVRHAVSRTLLTLLAVLTAAVAGGLIGMLCAGFIESPVGQLLVGGTITVSAIGAFLMLLLPVIRQEARLSFRALSSRLPGLSRKAL